MTANRQRRENKGLEYELIFYLARKTAACQDRLAAILTAAGLTPGTAAAATGARELGYALASAVQRGNLVLLVGGLSRADGQNVLRVLAGALGLDLVLHKGQLTLRGAHRLDPPQQTDLPPGCIVESGRQSIVLLPDDPDMIAYMMENSGLAYLRRKYGLIPAPSPVQQEQQALRRLGREVPAHLPLELAARSGQGNEKRRIRPSGRRRLRWALGILAAVLVLFFLAGLYLWQQGLLPSWLLALLPPR